MTQKWIWSIWHKLECLLASYLWWEAAILEIIHSATGNQMPSQRKAPEVLQQMVSLWTTRGRPIWPVTWINCFDFSFHTTKISSRTRLKTSYFGAVVTEKCLLKYEKSVTWNVYEYYMECLCIEDFWNEWSWVCSGTLYRSSIA